MSKRKQHNQDGEQDISCGTPGMVLASFQHVVDKILEEAITTMKVTSLRDNSLGGQP
ncbi:Hypothetical protein FKW44_014656 [Caligus rogercresseyi]|uniref:Uncharacterized protein n=1 Tax=Caligus rogercresseyi TaxID=217165 RepID=A0A7T8GZG6_CALRO|nr:Hypothetical protein FKW44_014656 [Caligus rogercresseyi]